MVEHVPPPKSVLRLVEQAIRDFDLVPPGARVAVGVSGGKDSLLLLSVMRQLAMRPDLGLRVEAVHLDQHQPGFDRAGFEAALARFDVPLNVVSKDTWSVVSSQLEPGQIPCALCGRMRRAILLEWCRDHGFDRLALGHHLDDAIETLFLNLFFQRKLEPLKAATPSESTGVATIRPLILVEEAQIADWVARAGLSPIACPVCDDFPRSARRDAGDAVSVLAARYPQLRASVRQALYGR